MANKNRSRKENVNQMFPGSMTLKQRRLRDKYQVVKDMSNFPVKFTTDNFNVTKEDATILKELYEECNIKSV